MNERLEKTQKELTAEIKKIASEIAKTDSFIGLIANELKIRELHEKLLILKFMERQRLDFNDFEQPLPPEIEEAEMEEPEAEELAPSSKKEVETMVIQDKKELVLTMEEDDFDDFLKSEKQLPEIQIDFNDRMAFLNQLFDGDIASYDLMIEALHRIDSPSSSQKYLSELKKEMHWTDKEEYLNRLEILVLKRFE